MNAQQKYEKIIKLLCEKFDADPQDMELSTRLRDEFNADTLDVTEIIMALERAFAIEIPLEKAHRKLTIGDLAELCGAIPGGQEFE